MKIVFIIISIVTFVTNGSVSEMQESKIVNGIVTAFRQYPVNNVKVTSGKSDVTVYTDSLGRFSIERNEKDVIVFEASGFSSKKLRIGKQNTYTVDLLYKDNVKNYNDVISGGHLSDDVLRKGISDSQQKNVKDYSVYATIYELIANEIYSVKVSGTSIYNKKIRSFDQTPQVLYVVDGKIISDIGFVNTSDVKTIEFVDDVGSSLYGMQGANGVIRIELK